MNLTKSIFLSFTFLSIIFLSCKSGGPGQNDALINIPATTSSVTSFNLNNLMTKADYPAIQKMDFFQEMLKEIERDNPSVAAVIKDPASSGINLDQNIYFTQEINPTNIENGTFFLVASIKDASVFKKLVTGDNGEIKTGEGYEFIKSSSQGITGWNDQIAVLGMAQSRRNELETDLNNFFQTKKEESIAQNENLKKCLSKSADVVSWFSSESLEGVFNEMGMALAMAGISKEMLKGNYSHSYLNFNNGEIVSDSDYEINEDLAEAFGGIFKDNVGTDFSKYLPSDNLLFATSLGLSTEGIHSIIKKRGMDGMADIQLKQLGTSLDEIVNTLDGDLMVGAVRVEGSEMPSLIVSTKLKDKTAVDKFINIAKEYEIIEDAGDNVYNLLENDLESIGQSPQLYIKDNLLFLGDATNGIAPLKAGSWSSNTINGELKKAINNNVFGLAIDFQNILKYPETNEIDLSNLMNLTTGWGTEKGTFKLDMKDKNTNSLKSIFEIINTNYQKQKMKGNI